MGFLWCWVKKLVAFTVLAMVFLFVYGFVFNSAYAGVNFSGVKIDTMDIFIYTPIVLAALGAIFGVQKLIDLANASAEDEHYYRNRDRRMRRREHERELDRKRPYRSEREHKLDRERKRSERHPYPQFKMNWPERPSGFDNPNW